LKFPFSNSPQRLIEFMNPMHTYSWGALQAAKSSNLEELEFLDELDNLEVKI